MSDLNVIEKCEQEVDITWEEYCEGANRTLSNHFFHDEDYPYALALNKMGAFIKAGQALDQLKKALFYGRNLEEAQQEYADQESGVKDPGNFRGRTKWPTHIDPKLIHSILGIATESVELVEALMSALLNESELDAVNIAEEIGDILWYVAIPYNIGFFDRGLQPIMRKNLLKLYARFPAKFTQQLANERDLGTEREVLETVN